MATYTRAVPRILFVHGRKASFIDLDRRLLAERWAVEEWYQPGPLPSLRGLVRALRRSDLVFGWWAHWHSFWAITLGRLLRKPSALVVGGFDTASLPEIGYGFQRGGVRKWASRWVMREATCLMTNSHYTRGEIERNVGIRAKRVAVVHHGVPDIFGSMPQEEREPSVVTVGIIDRFNLHRKGLRPFVETAALLPELSFVLVGRFEDDAIDELRARAAPNVTFTGSLPEDSLADRLRRAVVYLQPSLHEGFGVAVAEAMLAGCVPVVTAAGALPEVVGDAGIVVPSPAPAELAAAVRRALELGDDAPRRARERVLTHFPVELRREGLRAVVEAALAGGAAPSSAVPPGAAPSGADQLSP